MYGVLRSGFMLVFLLLRRRREGTAPAPAAERTTAEAGESRRDLVAIGSSLLHIRPPREIREADKPVRF